MMRNIPIIIKRIWKDIKDYRVAILVLMLYNLIVRSVFHAFCPQLILTGFPCAGCGLTRAVFCILTGQFARGLQLNPVAPLWMLFLIWFLGNRYLRGIYPKKTTLLLGLVCTATFGVYLYRMLHFFPGEPPMVYYRNNILRRVFMGV